MNQSALVRAYTLAHRARCISTVLLAGSFVAAQVMPALATIDNTANAIGTYGGVPANYGSSTQNVPVAPGAAALTVTKSAGLPTTASGADNTIVDANDTITYTYTVKNTGTVTLTGVVPVDTGPTFNGSAATAALGAFSPVSATLAPNATQVFTAVYTMSQLDVDHGAGIASGVVNSAVAKGTRPDTTLYTIPPAGASTATATIPAGPKLTISKTYSLADIGGGTAGKADLGEIITYTYTVVNTGNVAMTNVQVNDQHGTPPVGVPLGAGGITNETLTAPGPLGAGANSDGTANNGIWSVLAPGATVTFTWAHTVTQAEIDKG